MSRNHGFIAIDWSKRDSFTLESSKVGEPGGTPNIPFMEIVEPDRRPYCCPVCSGSGQVSSTLYDRLGARTTTAIMQVNCRSCCGTGVVWG